MKLKNENVFGEELQDCCHDPKTGFYRTGKCETGMDDMGRHLVCAVMSEEFLEFSRQRGNDLMTPRPEFGFPGIKPGDRWCLCVDRWKEALDAGLAPQVVLAATHKRALEVVDLDQLTNYAMDVN